MANAISRGALPDVMLAVLFRISLHPLKNTATESRAQSKYGIAEVDISNICRTCPSLSDSSLDLLPPCGNDGPRLLAYLGNHSVQRRFRASQGEMDKYTVTCYS